MTSKENENKAPENAPEQSSDKAPEPSQERTRRIVRSASTRSRPSFTEAGAEGAEKGAESGAVAPGGAADAGAAGGAEGNAPAAPRVTRDGRPVLDMRAPRTQPAGGASRSGPPGHGHGPRGGGPRPGMRRPRPGGPPDAEGRPGGRPGGEARGPRPERGEWNPDQRRSRGPHGPGAPLRRGDRPEGAGAGRSRAEVRPRAGEPSRPNSDTPVSSEPVQWTTVATGGRPLTPRRPVAPPPAPGRPGVSAKPRAEGDRAAAAKPAPKAAPEAKPQTAAAQAAKPAAPADKPKSKPTIVPVYVPLVKTAEAKKPAPTAKEVLSAKAAKAAGGKPKQAEGAPKQAAAEAEPFSPEALNAGWENAKDALVQAGDRAAALIDAWVASSNAAAIAAAAESNETHANTRKAAKRALNVLKSRGVAIPAKPEESSAVADISAEACQATMLPPDGAGTSSISITSREPSGRYHIAEVILREPQGILNAGSAWLSGWQLKENRNRAVESMGVAPVSVPLEWARFRIAQAKKMNAVSKQVLPLGLDRCKELIEPAPEAEPKHPVADLEEMITSEIAWARSPDSASLHAEPEFRYWFPERRALEDVLSSVGKRLSQDEMRDSARVSSVLKEEIDAATDRFFSPEARNALADRMRDSAISVRARRGDTRAMDVLATARALREAGLITSPPREIPFLIVLMEKGMSALAQQAGGSLRIPVAQGGA